MQVDLIYPLLQSEHDSAYDSIAEITLKYNGVNQTRLDVNGTDISYRVMVETKDDDVVISLYDWSSERLLTKCIATNKDFGLAEFPDDSLIESWSNDLKSTFENVPPELATLSDVLAVIAKLPVIAIWNDRASMLDSRLALAIELHRSLTTAESFALIQLGFDRLILDEKELLITFVWD